jgi:eukaryotic-like serine/threonine-protein kinase
VVYIGSTDGKLYAFDATLGTQLVTYTTGNAISSSPVVANGVVLVGSTDGKFYALHI